MNCPKCSDAHTVRCGTKKYSSGLSRQRWQCMGCGHYFLTELQPQAEANNDVPVKSLQDF